MDNFEDTGEIFSMRILFDYCRRASGRTQHIAEVVLEHLQENRSDILIVVLSTDKMVDDFVNYIKYRINEENIPMYHMSNRNLISHFSQVNLTHNFTIDTVRGLIVRDVIFDTPELTFFNNTKNFEVAMQIYHALSHNI